MVMKAQLRWSGHLVRMPGNRLPQKIFYGKLVKGKRSQDGKRKRYKDCLKSTLKMDVDNWERIAQDRKSWRKVVSSGPSGFEARRISDAETKRWMPSQAYSQLFQIQSSPVHSAEEGFMRELGSLATHGFIKNPEIYKPAAVFLTCDGRTSYMIEAR